jgi:hypothetical protein
MSRTIPDRPDPDTDGATDVFTRARRPHTDVLAGAADIDADAERAADETALDEDGLDPLDVSFEVPVADAIDQRREVALDDDLV